MDLTVQQLAASTGASSEAARAWRPFILEALGLYEIDTPTRAAAFLPQVGHESGGLKWVSEIWGPTADQVRYERDFVQPWCLLVGGQRHRNSKPFELGNTQRGDGARYRGHGLLQTTGRANHVRVRDRLRVKLGDKVPDFEALPEQLATFEWAALSAADYWSDRGLNALADAGDFQRITRKINGGLNGIAQREALWDAARVALGA